MKEIIDFLIKANKLKETIRTGWIIWRIKNPETIAGHTFRVCFFAFLFGKLKGLNLKKSIQMALSHDLCEIYAGDTTPLFYYQGLDVKRKEDRKILMKGIRLLEKEKKRRLKAKTEREKRSLLKLIAPLEKGLKSEIFLRWLDYEKGLSSEGRLVKQLGWIENLLQSLEYLGPKGSGSGWWEIAEEKVYDPLLLDFLDVLQKRFYKEYSFLETNKELENILDFLLEIGKLKHLPRLYWKAMGIKNPETVAEHLFSVALIGWVLGKKKKNLDMERVLKMALCHELPAIFTGDTIPYIERLPKDKEKRKEILKEWPRLPKREKIKRFKKEYKEERRALFKLIRKLDPQIKEEILELWEDYRKVKTPEATFLIQVNTLAVLLQGLLYQKKYKEYLADPLWEWAFERCTDPVALEFLEALKEKFYLK